MMDYSLSSINDVPVLMMSAVCPWLSSCFTVVNPRRAPCEGDLIPLFSKDAVKIHQTDIFLEIQKNSGYSLCLSDSDNILKW